MTGSFPEIPFSKSTVADWQRVATHELDGANPFDKLEFRTGDLAIKPYYDKIDRQYSSSFTLNESINPYYGPRHWMNVPKIRVNDERESNLLALNWLRSGADGILFETNSRKINFESLLKEIKPDYCQLSFYSTTTFDFQAFLNWAEKINATKHLTGYVVQKVPYDFEQSASYPEGFFPYGIVVKPMPNVADEIANALFEATELIERSQQSIIKQIAFSISVTNQLFIDLAKLKALRLLWHQVQGAYGVSLKPVHIHATTGSWQPSYQPHGSMIKSTTAALAAVLGGCDSLTLEADDIANPMMTRVARNVSSILREEGQLNKVADPTAGSFYVDSLVNQIAEKAWLKFQDLTK